MSYNKKLTLAGLQHMLQYYHSKLMSIFKTVAFTGDYSDLTNSPNYTLTQDSTNGHILNFSDGTNVSVITIPDNNTVYHGGTGISVSGDTINNTGVTSLSLSTGSTNGTIAYNISGVFGEVSVKGLGSAAYTASSDYASISHTHDYLPLSGGTLTGGLTLPSGLNGKGLHINASSGDGLYLWGDNEGGNIRICSPASLETPRYYEIDAQSGDLRVYTTPVDIWSMTVPLLIKPDGIQVSTINGKKINTATTTVFNGIPVINGDGVMEVGRYLDFHYNNDTPSTTDKSARVSVNTNGALETSGSFVANGSLVATREVILGNGEYLHTVTGGNGNGIKFTFFTNPLFQILPEVDNVAVLGHSSYRFAEVRAVNMYISSGTAVTSDRRKKNTINDINPDFAENLIMGLKPSSFKYNDGQSDRLHYGFIAQDVEELIGALCVSSKDFAPLIIDKIKEEIIDKDADGNERRKLVETGEVEYSLRYEEFIAPIIAMIQKQQKKINELESRLEVIGT